MTKEQDFFLQIIKDHLHDMPTDEQYGIDWNSLYEISQSHQMTAIVYFQCKKFIPADYLQLFRSSYLNTISVNTQRKHLTEEIEETFQKNNVPYFLVKGDVISKYYPQEMLRTMGDTDIVSSEREVADAVLCDLDLVCSRRSDDYEWSYAKNGIVYELHDRLIHNKEIEKGEKERVVSFFSDAFQYVENHELNIKYHFLFLIYHLRKHMMGCGVGFRQFVDIAVVIKRNQDLDWNWINEKLDQMGLRLFADTVFAFLDKWFGVSTSFERITISDDLFEKSTGLIFKNGVFGFDNKEDLENKDVRDIVLYENESMTKARLKYFLRIAFPSYQTMRKKPEFRYINKCAILLPFAWCHRVILGVLNRDKRNKVSVSQFLTTPSAVHNVELLQQWGI